MGIDWDSLEIDKHYIFKHTTQEAIFEYYLKLPVDESEFYLNPLRNDKHEGCKYFYDRNNRLWFIDFAGRSYDCFNVVEVLYSCKYHGACRIIAKDFGLLKGSNPIQQFQTITASKEKREGKTTIRVKRKKFYPKEALAFWEKFKLNLTKEELVNELYAHGIHCLDAAWLQFEDESLKQIYDYNKYKPAYLYIIDNDDNYQLYYPYNGKDQVRFIQTTNSKLHFYNNLPERGEYLVITKSRKDAFLLRQFGILSIAVMSERGIINKDLMINLQLRFNKIFTLFDRDRTGIQATIRFKKQYDTIPLLIPVGLGKDFSDMLLQEGLETTVDIINEVKEYYDLND